jgi:GntR family transcriptional regulator / MocR family aminotransferase
MSRAAYRPKPLREGVEQPLFLQIARQIAEDIRRRVLPAGARVPGSRELSRALGVHRNTALAALSELTAQGWIQTEARRGTFVSRDMPDSRPASKGLPAHRPDVHLELPPGPPLDPFSAFGPDVLPLIGGTPDYRLAPTAELSRAYRRALSRDPRLLGYGSELGDPRLRSALATQLRETRGILGDADGLLVTRGSQMALFLLGRALASPARVVAVEGLGYRPCWEALRLSGVRIVALPVDGAGLSIDALARLLEKERVAAVYTTPHHQYPTTVTLTAPRRLELLALARRHGFIVIEDDYDHEHHYDGRSILPLASVDPDVVAYVGTLSKILAPGLRVGYLAARPEILERAARVRTYVDRAGDHVVERALAELIEEDVLGRHVRRVRREYQARRDALVYELRRRLSGALSFREPSGGMALWAKVIAPGVLSEDWAARALERKVLLHPGRRFRFDGRATPYLRMGFAPVTPEEIEQAVERLAAALPDRAPRGSRKARA